MQNGFFKIVLIVLTLSGLVLPSFSLNLIGNQVRAEEEMVEESAPEELLEPSMPGRIQGTGTYFEIKDSDYLNITLESAEEITVILESIPRMISMNINSSTDAFSTVLTIKGLEPNKTYYQYQDSYKNEAVFISDENGNYSWTQDLVHPHHIWFQEIKGTIFLPEDCSKYGNWDEGTKTCTLNQDLIQSVEITSDNITFDGNGHRITGGGTGYGIYLNNRVGVTIKNTTVTNFSTGIVLYSSNSNTLNNNTALNNSTGIVLWWSSNNILTNNTASNNWNGIYLWSYSSNNTLNNNTASNNWYGILLGSSSSNILTNNTASNNWNGIYLWSYSSNNTLNNNTVSNNYYGIVLYPSSNNTLNNNTANSNNRHGIYLLFSSNNTLNNNTANSNNYYGIVLVWSSNNKVYHNNFIDNWEKPQAYVYGGSGNLFDDSYPSGGNYWSDYTGVDSDGDGIGDTPYVFAGGQDNYPWIKKDGWLPQPPDGPPAQQAAELAKELVNHPEAYLWGGKGWDYNLDEFVSPERILSGYTYWNPDLPGRDIGIGVDCSGLITWAFNRSFDPFVPAINNFVKYVNANGLHSGHQSDAVTEAELLPGDAMFFDWDNNGYIDHTAMYVGESGGYDVVSATSKTVGIISKVKNDYKLLTGFEDFRRIHQADVEMEIAAGSPVDLAVTDPDGFTITSNSIILSDEEYIREVPDFLYYVEMEQGSDGNPIDRVYSPTLKTGNYIIEVSPSPGSLPTDTYSLEFMSGEQTVILADNVPISEIPSGGHGVAVEESGDITPFIPVSIDIKPGSFPNSINLNSGGTLPVVIFGTATFDVTHIDPATVTLADVPIRLKDNGQPMASYEDVNGDSIRDILVHVVTKALGLTDTDVQTELNGLLLDGQNIKGFDSVRIVP